MPCFKSKYSLAFINGWKGVSSSDKQEFVDKNEKKGKASLKLNQDGDDAFKYCLRRSVLLKYPYTVVILLVYIAI